MDDPEITRRCAEAMGEEVYEFAQGFRSGTGFIYRADGSQYDPLHDDAQCMALIKRLRIDIAHPIYNTYTEATVTVNKDGLLRTKATGPDLNRAVCTAVAQMEVERG